ncbi:hypothetical protein EOM60_00750 [Candidatus Saccharibacteria bacterium]|nr:hypothetical protein [Candidatus Saccharibacteria bacterium]
MPRKNYPKRQKSPSANNQTVAHWASWQTSTCQSKKRYSTEKIAKRELETRELIQSNLELDVYLCSVCNGWHLTSKVSQ